MTILEIKFTEWLQKGFELFINNAVLLLLSGLVAGLISFFSLGLLSGPMLAGMAMIIRELQDPRLAKPAVNDLFRGFDYFKDTLPVTIFFYAVGFCGYVLAAVPFVGQLIYTVVAGVCSCLGILTIFHLADRRIAPLQSYRTWVSIFKLNWGPLLGFFILVFIIQTVGAVAIGVGLLVTFPLSLCILGCAYKDIARQSAAL